VRRAPCLAGASGVCYRAPAPPLKRGRDGRARPRRRFVPRLMLRV